jgi:D-alanyl-lipoteichoic acid acyltransferase DltB (MBOAT superfamily)
MSFLNIAILIGISLGIYILCLFPRSRAYRNTLLLVISIVVIYWLQPELSIRYLDFWLPTGTLILAMLCWALTCKPEERHQRGNLISAAIIVGCVLLIALTRNFSEKGVVTPSRPPQMLTVVLVLFISLCVIITIGKISHLSNCFLTISILVILGLFLILKLPRVSLFASAALRGMSGQSKALASNLDIRWLGFSYIAFRLIHTLRDRQSGRLLSLRLDEYFIYVLFFPAISAGPIDRVERFTTDLRRPLLPDAEKFGSGFRRIVIGLLKKFVLADTLSLIALNATNALQVHSIGWSWVTLYAYTFQIFFDFSGYTDIAIGMAQLMGIHLPENFNAPYLKANLTQFWNSWHITLSQWIRTYFFNPFTRYLRSRFKRLPIWVVILLTQLSTMALIGLWHGITLNFLIWGIWHGFGLFIQNRWSEWTRPLSLRVQTRPILNRFVTVFSTFLTFQFVALGWVWFTLPDVTLSVKVFARLFGLGGVL